MKYLIIALSLFPVIASAEVHYRDYFDIKSGFYKGCYGMVISQAITAKGQESFYCNIHCKKQDGDSVVVYNEVFKQTEIEAGKK